MPIEFSCPHCGKQLKTRVDDAGQSAPCPDCGTLVTVREIAPSHGVDQPEVGSASPWADPVSPDSARVDEHRDDADDAEPGGEVGPLKTCPMCGNQIRATARGCRFCGERFERAYAPEGGFRPTSVEVSEIVSTSWALFTRHGLMLGVGTFLFTLVVSVAAMVAYGIVIAVVIVSTGGMQPGRAPPSEILVLLTCIPCGLGFLLVMSYATAGHTLFYLNVLKGREPDLADLIRGGPWLLRIFVAFLVSMVANFVVGMIVMVPIVLIGALTRDPQKAIVAVLIAYAVNFLVSLYLGMRITPFPYHAIDQNSGIFGSLYGAWRLTGVNHFSEFVVIYLMSVPLVFIAMLACGIPSVVTMPLYMAMQSVAYVLMSGRRVRMAE